MDRGFIITDIEGNVTEFSLTEEGVEIIKLKKGGKNGERKKSDTK